VVVSIASQRVDRAYHGAVAEYEAKAISAREKVALAAAKARATRLGGLRWKGVDRRDVNCSFSPMPLSASRNSSVNIPSVNAFNAPKIP
jgi:hypothetical protein